LESCRIIRAPGEAQRTQVSCLPPYLGAEPMWEVLRWMIVFVLALLLIVAAIYLVTGRALPIPQF